MSLLHFVALSMFVSGCAGFFYWQVVNRAMEGN